MRGIDWQSVGAIVGLIALLFSIATWVLLRRDKRSQDENQAIKQEIADSVNHLGEVLLAKLETKETVARISERLARLEGAAGIQNNINNTGG